MAFSINGVGTTWYGHALEEPDGSYVVTEWIIFFCPNYSTGIKTYLVHPKNETAVVEVG